MNPICITPWQEEVKGPKEYPRTPFTKHAIIGRWNKLLRSFKLNFLQSQCVPGWFLQPLAPPWVSGLWFFHLVHCHPAHPVNRTTPVNKKIIIPMFIHYGQRQRVAEGDLILHLDPIHFHIQSFKVKLVNQFPNEWATQKEKDNGKNYIVQY